MPRPHTLALVAVLALGSALRLAGLDWGIASLQGFGAAGPVSIQAASFHPDETTLTAATASLGESIHPHLLVRGQTLLYSVYGPVFMYLFQGVARLAGAALGSAPFGAEPAAVDATRLAGRAVSALAGCATLWLTWRLGTLAYGRAVGLVAALLLAATALHIQSSHFATVDVLMALWATWSFLPMVRLASSGRSADAVAAGLLIGLAAATKLSALALLLPLVVAHALGGRRGGRPLSSPRAHRPLLAACAVAVLAFAVLVPSAWLRPLDYFGPAYHGNVLYSARLNEGDVIMRGSLHYAGTPAYWYQLVQHFPAGMGLALEVAAALACLWALVRRAPADLPIAGFALAYFLVVGSFETKYVRYFVVLMPLAAVLAARLLVDLWEKPRGVVGRLAGRGAGAVVVGLTVAHGVAFASVYGDEDSRVEAVRWVAGRAPGSTVALERGHNSLSALVEAAGLRAVSLDIAHFYGRPTPDELRRDGDYLGLFAAGPLSGAEYLVFAEDQLVARDRNPFAAQYYQFLFAGDLGFALERRVERPPRLFGRVWDDAGADLSWRHFDHPVVYVFRRTGPPGVPAAYPQAGIYWLRSWEEARQVVRRALAFEEFLFLEHVLPDPLRRQLEREDLIRGVNDLIGRSEVRRCLERPEAYVEEGGRWKLHVVADAGRLRLQLADGTRVP